MPLTDHFPQSPSAPSFAVRTAARCLTLCALLWVFSAAPARANQNDELMTLLGRIESSYAKVEDYSAVFRKKERVKDKLRPEEAVSIKFRKPFQVYMKWLDGPLKEALYVDGENNNKVVAHCDGTGANLTWKLDPKGSILMADNRHPITDIGFGFIINLMRINIPLALRHAELEVVRLVDENFMGRKTTVLEARFTPKEGRQYYATRVVCHIDKEYLLPIGIACYDERDALMEQYAYQDLKVNVGLNEKDFSRDNPEYKF